MNPLTDRDIMNLFFISLAFACVWPGVLIMIRDLQKKHAARNSSKNFATQETNHSACAASDDAASDATLAKKD